MKRKSVILIAFALIGLLFVSCEKENPLIYSSNSFSAPISCISEGSIHNDSIYYIGLENGNIIRINIINNSQRVIAVGNNRVYDVYEKDRTTLFVGIRNEGTKKISLLPKSKRSIQYLMVDPSDSTKLTTTYSTYHIEADTDKIYVATSAGLYTLSNTNSSTNLLDRKPLYRPKNHTHYHFGINQVLVMEDKIVAATSDSGLVLINKNNPNDRQCLTHEEVHSLYRKDDSIVYATSNNSIYKININKRKCVEEGILEESDDNLFAFISEKTGETWKLTSSKIEFTDTLGKASFQFPNKLNDNYKNYLLKGKDFIFVACHNILYKFSLHQNPLGNANNVIAACTNNSGLCYFITLDNKLYSIKKGDSCATLIGKLKHITSEKPIKLHTTNDQLWLITSNSLLKINPINAETSLEIGPPKSNAKVQIKEKRIDFRSIYDEKGTLFIGTRNYLLKARNLNGSLTFDSIRTKDKSIDFSDLYITDINKSGPYFSSLKHGLFTLDKDLLIRIEGSDTIGEIRRVICQTDNKTYIYTSRGVYLFDSSRLNKISSLPKSILTIYNETNGFFILGYNGIIKTSSKDEIRQDVNNHLDLSLNEAAIGEGVDKETPSIYIGTQAGLYLFNGSLKPIIIPVEKRPLWQIVGVSLISLLIILFTIYLLAKRRTKQDKKIISTLEDIIKTSFKEENHLALQSALTPESVDKSYNVDKDSSAIIKTNKQDSPNKLPLIPANLKGVEKVIDPLIKDCQHLKNQNWQLTIELERLSSQHKEATVKVDHFIQSIIEEIKKYQNFLSEEERERFALISQNEISFDTLTELKNTTTNLIEILNQYIYTDDLPAEMRTTLKKIFDKHEHRVYIDEIRLKSKDSEKIDEQKEGFNYIKEQSELFFQAHRPLLGIFDNWSGTKKAVACLYLSLSKPLAQDVVTNLYDRITGKTASDIRAEIHADLNEVTCRNYLLDKLWNKTRSTRNAKNGNKPEKEESSD